MSNTKSNTIFDDDFEVTYEEEIPFSYGFDTKPVSEKASDKTVIMDPVNYRTKPDNRQSARKASGQNYGKRRSDSSVTDYEEDDGYYNDGYEDSCKEIDYDNYEDNEGGRYSRSVQRYEDDLDDEDLDSYGSYSRPAQRKRAKRNASVNILSPVKKTAKYGTKAIYRVARSVVRIVSLLITAGTLGVLAYNFWRGAAPYGDPLKILTEKNYALAAYAAVAAIFLLFELIAFFWSMTKMRIKEGRKVYREDTGRGLFSFIFIYIASYLSFLLCSFLPDTLGSYAVLNGARGALDVFGSMHNVLLGLCLAGVISCLVRRHMN